MNSIEKLEKYIKEEGDTSGNLREVESVEEVGELARASGKRLKKIFSEGTQEEWLDELNEVAIDLAISKGKSESFKFNDSSKKKSAMEELLDEAGEDNIKIDYSRGFSFDDNKEK